MMGDLLQQAIHETQFGQGGSPLVKRVFRPQGILTPENALEFSGPLLSGLGPLEWSDLGGWPS